ncbi:molecular chaperone [Paenibacillus agilis]|uniref:Molecular chaperone n=1 Tax=Paenibacillus agilis TaxID=3020863 RepID=A0A559J3U0_9BACL|nr:molecular chaperone [Paenibacillus agilis]TVX94543.1 molecular chaperone [Paenibacillus agilis]
MYSYRLYTNGNPKDKQLARYTREELTEMTTLQLRNICFRERLVESYVNPLDREGMIATLLKFRGADLEVLIRKYNADGFERVAKALRHYLLTPLSDNGSIKVPARMFLYDGLHIDKRDQYRVEAGSGIVESNVLLVNEHQELCGILNLVRADSQTGQFYFTREAELELRQTVNQQYSFLFFRKQDSDYLYRTYNDSRPQPPANLHFYRIPVADLEIRQLEQTDAVLAIDFGTSNTTAGAYLDNSYISSPCSNDLLNGLVKLNSMNVVAFPDSTNKETQWIEVLPTLISIADCSEPKEARFHFGYEALMYMRKNGYSGQASVFHGMKRWVNDYKRIEEVMDGQGNAAAVSRIEMLRAYVEYVVQTAEHQFKCKFKHLHLSSPVKLKTQFIDMFREVLPHYKIESANALDEGMAVLYNAIADQLDKDRFLDGEEYKALVIDCGGGTTDLSSCRFRIEDSHISYKLDIHTSYENGDTNFGGNNITYRIMQFMKIVFAQYYRTGKTVPEIDSFIDIPSQDIYRYVDEHGVDAVYRKFEDCYLEAERLIPTRFMEYENRARDEYHSVRNNFYFLWELADSMKKEFFRKTSILRNRFHDSAGTNGQENDLKITAVERWCLALLQNGQFKDVYEAPTVEFNIKEINQLIRADIYEIVRKFLDEFYYDGRLQEYSIIKLTGQSCRIDVFREALKEFVPGRAIEFRQKAEDADEVPELKLACLRGAIRYLSARKAGIIEATITQEAPVVPYQLTAITHNRHEKVLMASHQRLDQVNGFISRPMDVAETEFYLKESDGELRRKLVYRNKPDSNRAVMYEEIARLYGHHILQEDTDSIVNGEVKFFVFAQDSNWGFHVVPVSRQHEQLYIGKKEFFAFENDLSELDFFDGLK